MNMGGVAGGAGMSGMAGCSGSQHSQMASGAMNKDSENRKTTLASKGTPKNLEPNLGGEIDIAV
ncbi:hypothetical protein AXX12_15015 [Anaerosporomusa subterranea]|uniref:Uncharacterized protein n=1 Tax=Anaerosporomusa subterranea TaxID=1794912 RepID=A0A154BM21_ANASB|nr:hypothetical protein [Anaerosporomusa subterranea]KYZ74890.1 hypothetical protein AXX12_15015 [Anaerosporomusa subterranea]